MSYCLDEAYKGTLRGGHVGRLVVEYYSSLT